VAEPAHPSAKTGPCPPAVAGACEGAGLTGVQGTPTPLRRVWASRRGGASRAVLSRPSSRGCFFCRCVCACVPAGRTPARLGFDLAAELPSAPATRRAAAELPGLSSNIWWATGSVGLKKK
jgi:hypothetical protein